MLNKNITKNNSGNVTNVSGDGNVVAVGSTQIDRKAIEIVSVLNDIAQTSQDKNEVRLAKEAIARIQENNIPKFKKFILDNIPPLISGTFAAAAGGMLVEFFKGILAG